MTQNTIIDPIIPGQVWFHKKQDSLLVVLAVLQPKPNATGWAANEKGIFFSAKNNDILTKTIDKWFDDDHELWYDPSIEEKVPPSLEVKNPKSRIDKIRELQGAAHPNSPELLLGGYNA